MKLMDQIRTTLRRRHYSPRTEDAYTDWILRYIRFHGIRHSGKMGPDEVVAFLNHLALERRLSASTQNQCLSALVFLYKRVLGISLDDQLGFERARRYQHLPEVLSTHEVMVVLKQFRPPHAVMAGLLYGQGVRPAQFF